MPGGQINIYNYTDFRAYLTDAYEENFRQDKSFSKSFICRELGVPNSRSFFTDILKGKRQLSDAKMERIIEVFHLIDDEAAYFRFMVKYTQTEIESEKDFYFNQLLKMNKAPKKALDPQLYADYYGEWYHSTIRALLDIVDFDGNYEELAARLVPPVSVDKVRHSVALLYKLWLIDQNEDGYWKPIDQLVRAKPTLKQEVLLNYNLHCLDVVCDLLRNKDKHKKSISTKTLSLSDSAYDQIMERLSLFKEEVSSIIHKDAEPATTVYQMNIQFISQSNEGPA